MNGATETRCPSLRILYFSFVELDVPNACSTHTLGILRAFSHGGCTVNAIVPRPVHARKAIPNVRFHYLWPWQFSAMGAVWARFQGLFLMTLLCSRRRYDAIYVREIEANPGPRLCSRRFRIPLYVEVNDLLLPLIEERGAGALSTGIVRHCQREDFQQAAGLIVPSVPMCDWIVRSYGLPPCKVHLILNGTDLHLSPVLSRTEARERLNLPSSGFCLGFVGNLYREYDFDLILDALSRCRNSIKDLCVVFVGDGPMARHIRTKTRAMGMQDRTRTLGYVASEKLGEIVPAMDVGLLIRVPEGASRYGPVSTKLSTYGGFALPVITAGWTLEGYPSDLKEGLFLVPPGDATALASMLHWLHSHPDERKKKAQVLHEFVVRKMTWDRVGARILDVMRRDRIAQS